MRCWIHSPISALLSVLLVLQLVLPGTVAHAAAPTAQARKSARAAFQRAQAAYEAERFEEALAAYNEANELMPNVAFIFNMAQCHRQLGQEDEALTQYQRYLEASPDAKNREVVEAHIRDLETAIAQRVPEKPVLTPSEELMLRRQQEEQEAAALAAANVAPPVYQTWWFWTATAVVVGGVATGVALSQGGGNKPPSASLGDVSLR